MNRTHKSEKVADDQNVRVGQIVGELPCPVCNRWRRKKNGRCLNCGHQMPIHDRDAETTRRYVCVQTWRHDEPGVLCVITAINEAEAWEKLAVHVDPTMQRESLQRDVEILRESYDPEFNI